MKKAKTMLLLLGLISVTLSGGCKNSGTQSRAEDQSAGADSIREEYVQENSSSQEKNDKQNAANASGSEDSDHGGASQGKNGKADIDLSEQSGTVVYAEVYNMMAAPETYIGKIIRIKGTFSVYHDEKKKKYYFACIVQDATACCAQGIEFEPAGACRYPDDYPKEGKEITVTGRFASYQEGDATYGILKDAKFE
jgi:hypothetical protein